MDWLQIYPLDHLSVKQLIPYETLSTTNNIKLYLLKLILVYLLL